MKTLIYRMGGLGDSILTYPILEILTKKGYEITVWGNTEYFSLAKIAGYCSRVTFYEPKEKFNLRIIFSKKMELFSSSDDSLYVEPIPNNKEWVVNWYLKKLNLYGEVFSRTLNLNFSVEKTPNLCLIHPGSGSEKKNPEIAFFLELEAMLKAIGFDVFFLLGPAEKGMIKFYKNFLYHENLTDVTKTILKAFLYIGLDSGISHLSSYLSIPSVVIFGPSDAEIWHPIGDKLWIIRNSECEPCFPNICEEKKCLNKDFLLEKINKILLDNDILF